MLNKVIGCLMSSVLRLVNACLNLKQTLIIYH